MNRHPYPEHAGAKEDHGTSRDAATAIERSGRAGRLREAILKVYAVGDYTADMTAAILGEDKLSIRPRVSELHTQGILKKTGRRSRNPNGKFANIFTLSR